MFSISPPQPSSFFATNRPRFFHSPAHIHAPQTPSPLRTSRNANLNFMPNASIGSDASSLLSSSPIRTFTLDRATGYNDENEPESHDESAVFGIHLQKTKTPEGKMNNGEGRDADAALITPPNSGSGSTSNSNLMSTQPFMNGGSAYSSSTAISSRQTSSGWEHRSRNASPAATLARHAAQGREKKKTQFLDRIRRRRDDSRSELYGDQVLRMDFVRERKLWEDEMNRRAMLEQASVLSGEEDDIEPGADADMHEGGEPVLEADQTEHHQAEAEMSPTEDHDVHDALAEYYAHAMQDQESVPSAACGNDDYLIDDDEKEYDQLFREMIAKGWNETSTQKMPPPERQLIDHGQRPQETRERNESSMDLS
ncbi:hypothetical protein A1O3_09947 [Capronia epimyces CBS 606.96]|uniref:Uncharacterized protein n=1 Tax=Capronia epimyces CBS 606.96 TaxID=1182542 RepID=W9XBW0_9EURO|nr:uncharacterized protein A1O3_09947 [Capronia epimyces CBS 606.96]EXJ77718.1 hypothetical protein A1O3_09947 [Capronia epimyces CBS 606.96]